MRLTLEENGLDATVRRAADRPAGDRLAAITEEIDAGRPAIMLIGTSRTPANEYAWSQRYYYAHWLSVWGYNADHPVVYLQDSYLYTEEWQPDLPIGHTTRPVERLMADWQGTVFTRPISYLYITVDPSSSQAEKRTEYVEVEDPLER